MQNPWVGVMKDCRLVVAHIDGGVTINAHDCGKMVDGNIGSGGDGPTRPPVSVVFPYLYCWTILRNIP